jgi:GxxExxY protein
MTASVPSLRRSAVLAFLACAALAAGGRAQAPQAAPAGGPRGGAPAAPAANALSPAQTAAVGAMDQAMTPLLNAVQAARDALAVASVTQPRDDAAIRAKAEAVAAADLALANARAERFQRIQSSANRLSPEQIAPLVTAAGRGGRGRGAAATTNPGGTGLNAAREETARLVTPAGVAATLFAAEPMMVNPTDIDVDARGRVWVNEGANYRALAYTREEGDRILILEDTNRDGVADKSTVFYQDPAVNAALGIMVLEGNKAIVAAAPYIFVLTDTNNDGVADKREVMFEAEGMANHDHSLHTYVFGPDGKLYFNFGNATTELKRPVAGLLAVPLHGPIPAHESRTVIDTDGKPVKNGDTYRGGMVFRANLDGSNVETLAHNFRNNYEIAVDSFGGLWQSDNDDDGNTSTRINNILVGGNYGFLDEITGAAWMTAYRAAGSPVPERSAYHWHQMDPGVVPNLLITGAGSPTGMTVYEGTLLPAEFRNQVFHTDARPGVTRAYPVTKAGAGYTATMAPILSPAPNENWYRPSDVAVGPDGALYVADWNDGTVGGHAMTDQILTTLTGRVYRLAPPGNRPVIPALNLNTAAGAVAALQSPNMNTRYLAWTKLHAMQAGAEAELVKLWQDRTNDRMRARALFLLSQIKGKEKTYLDAAARDTSEDIRIVALRAAHAAGVDVIPYAKQLARDPSALVRREAALALRHNPSPEVPAIWATLAQQHDGKDRWYLEALGIGADGRWNECLDAWQAAARPARHRLALARHQDARPDRDDDEGPRYRRPRAGPPDPHARLRQGPGEGRGPAAAPDAVIGGISYRRTLRPWRIAGCEQLRLGFRWKEESDALMHPLYLKADGLTETIIGAAIDVHRDKGPGLVESIYEWCLLCELQLRALQTENQRIVRITYKGFTREEPLRFDVLIEGCVLVECKSVEAILPIHKAQLLSYMKLLDVPVGLLINFNVSKLTDGVARVVLRGANQ